MADMTTHQFLARQHEITAYLAGRLTLLVRPVWPQPSANDVAYYPRGIVCGPLENYETGAPAGYGFESEDYQWRCPLGVPGDTLAWKEAFRLSGGGDRKRVIYRADNAAGEWLPHEGPILNTAWRPSANMPRWAVRPALRAVPVVDVRVMRVQSITEADCVAAGVEPPPDYPQQGYTLPERPGAFYAGAQQPFAELWDADNAKRGCDWASNPWVWAVTVGAIETTKGGG